MPPLAVRVQFDRRPQLLAALLLAGALRAATAATPSPVAVPPLIARVFADGADVVVARSMPAAAVGRYLDGLYAGKVATQSATSVVGYVPSGWSAQADLYRAVVGPDCMMCHLAAPAALNFESFGQLVQNKVAVYGTVRPQHTMPNAQVPYRHSWSATQPLGNTTLNLGGYLMATLASRAAPDRPRPGRGTGAAVVRFDGARAGSCLPRRPLPPHASCSHGYHSRPTARARP